MLPAFVIGLREGLETVVVIGAIVVFVRAQGRGDLLPRIWRACLAAALVCVAIGLVIRYVEVNLPWRQQERFETIVGLVAVATVTYMVVWMRRFPKDLRRDTDAAASAALTQGSGRGLVLLAFFAVLREGFEVTVFVVATIGLTGTTAWLSTGGALLGVVAALAVGIGVVRGTRHLDVARFFRVTAVVLVLSAAGIAMTTVHTANAAGWITFGQRPQFDLSWLAPPGSVLSSFTTGMFGLQPYPTLIEVVVWLVYFVAMMTVVLWPPRPAEAASRRHRRQLWLGAGGLLVALGVVLAVTLPSSSPPPRPVAASAKILFATLYGVTCADAAHCVAVGDVLPIDKDAAIGDPDGDGQATHTLVETSDGSTWARQASPDEGRGGAQLSSVSCPTTTDCVAVGFYRPDPFPASATIAPPDSPLIESDSGGRWQVVDGPATGANSVLTSVSCPTESACVAVGYTTVGQSDGTPVESFFVESFEAGSWSFVPLSPAAGTTSELNSVSCPTSSTCVAVGDAAPVSSPTDTAPLVEEMENGVWTAPTLPSQSSGRGILYDVACPVPGRCVTVGNAVTGQGSGTALVLSMAGTTWSVDQAASGQTGDPSLTALGCADPDDCVVAGQALESAEKVVGKVGPTTWQALASPGFSDNVQGITCPTASTCLAVGSVYVNGFGNTTALVTELSSGDWVAERLPAL